MANLNELSSAQGRRIAELERQLAEALDKDLLAARIHASWEKYSHVFGVPPHGTLRQLRAMLELAPEHLQYAIDAARAGKEQG